MVIMISMLSITYLLISEVKIFQQVIGISMGTNCMSHPFIYSYEEELIQKHSHDKLCPTHIVLWFCLGCLHLVSCVPYAVSFSELSIFDCPFGILLFTEAKSFNIIFIFFVLCSVN